VKIHQYWCPRPELDHKSTAANGNGSCTKMCPEPELDPNYMVNLRGDLLLP
jgi:hypothetical protein